MKNKEIEYLLNEMKDKECYYVGTNGCLYQDLTKKEINLLLSYIEQLQNNRDKAIARVMELSYLTDTPPDEELLKILRGDSDDE